MVKMEITIFNNDLNLWLTSEVAWTDKIEWIMSEVRAAYFS